MASLRISIPASAAVNEVIEIKTLITHPMESGFRRDALGRVIPRNILTLFECRFDGQTVFKTELHTGMAANPYISFSARVPHSGEFEFIWIGEHGFEAREVREIQVDS